MREGKDIGIRTDRQTGCWVMLSTRLQEEPESEDRVHNTTQKQAGQGPHPDWSLARSSVTWSELFLLSELQCPL